MPVWIYVNLCLGPLSLVLLILLISLHGPEIGLGAITQFYSKLYGFTYIKLELYHRSRLRQHYKSRNKRSNRKVVSTEISYQCVCAIKFITFLSCNNLMINILKCSFA